MNMDIFMNTLIMPYENDFFKLFNAAAAQMI
jgi:hypothetical protein